MIMEQQNNETHEVTAEDTITSVANFIVALELKLTDFEQEIVQVEKIIEDAYPDPDYSGTFTPEEVNQILDEVSFPVMQILNNGMREIKEVITDNRDKFIPPAPVEPELPE